MLVQWPSTKYTIKGKVVASPKSGPWWVLWIHVCLWFVRAPKALKLCINQLVVWFVQVHMSNWCLSLFLVPSRSSSTPLYPENVARKGACPNSLLFCYFTSDSHLSLPRSLGARHYLPSHPPMTYLPNMASYLPIHNPPKYYTFTHMYKVYLRIYILHIIYVDKGDWTLVSLAPHQCLGH
jgi:hypothetical protein